MAKGQPGKNVYDFDALRPGLPGFHSLLVEFSRMAYLTQSEIENELSECGYKGTNVLFFKSALTSGFVIEWDTVVVIAFKGTSTLREWVNNCNLYLKQTPVGRIHWGFYNSIQLLVPSLLPIILQRASEGRTAYATGHSRGGALAILFGFVLSENGANAGIVTFGAPRVGDAKFVNNLSPHGDRLSEWTTYIPGPVAWAITVFELVAWAAGFLGRRALARILARFHRAHRL